MEDENVPTTLAFVHTTMEGDRNFSFYRNPGADMMLTADEISDDMVKHAKVFHFGTLSMTHESVRQATMEAVKLAKITGFYGKSAKRNASFCQCCSMFDNNEKGAIKSMPNRECVEKLITSGNDYV